MAQGYINVDYEGEEYFRLLLQRCVFQDVIKDDTSEIKSFKMHDLLHDIAEQASGNEICRLNSDKNIVDNKVRHLTLSNDFCPQKPFCKTHVRTLFNVSGGTSQKLLAGNSIREWKCLRSLDLSHSVGYSLHKSIGELFHLRYLDLSWSHDLKKLPNSITNLVNLRTLTLRACVSLTKLPEDIYKLEDLSTLELDGCNKLSHMPSKLGKLTNLHTLGIFVVGGVSSSKKCLDGLKDLRSLNNLKGSLEVVIKVHDENVNYSKEDHDDGDYLIRKQHLSKIAISSCSVMLKDESREWEQSLRKNMQPHVDIKDLSLVGYKGEIMPRWPRREDNSTLFYFPSLVKLKIDCCRELQVLPPLEKLPHLKELSLRALDNIEYVVNVNLLEVPSLDEGSSFFPCLEVLQIIDLKKLKGWWPGSEEQNEPLPCFAKLKRLEIIASNMLKFISICSSLMSVELHKYIYYEKLKGDNMDLLRQSYQSLLPSDSKSRFITIPDLKRLVYDGSDSD